jgi:hypothetical protein
MTHQSKPHFIDAIRHRFAQEKNISCYVLVHPAWIAETTTPEAIPDISLWAARRGLVDYPDRRCVLIFSAEDHDWP